MDVLLSVARGDDRPSPKGNALVNKTKVLYRPRSFKIWVSATIGYVGENNRAHII